MLPRTVLPRTVLPRPVLPRPVLPHLLTRSHPTPAQVSFKAKLADMSLDQISAVEAEHRAGASPPLADSLVVRVEKTDPFASVVPWGILQRDAQMIGAEMWHVERQPMFASPSSPGGAPHATVKYRVHYYTAMGGDFFYSDVVPGELSASLLWSCAKARVKQWWRMRVAPSSGSGGGGASQAETTHVLPQPPKRSE